MAKPSKPLAGYIRVSRVGRRDRDELRAPDQQREAIERCAKSAGLNVRFFDPEIDVSGSKKSRKILDEIIAGIRAGELGGLIVAKLDRLARLPAKDRALLFEEIEDAGGEILSASESLDPSTPEGRWVREIFAGLARMQWEKYAEGFEATKAACIEERKPIVSRPAVGLRKLPDKTFEPIPELAPIILEVFERRTRAEGPTALGQFLESHGVRTSQGSRTWSKQAIYGLIKNPIYMGMLRYGKDNRYMNADGVEPIVDAATWHAAQHPNGRRLHAAKSGESSWLLTGVLRCQACRYCLQGTTTSHGKRIYRCVRTHAGGVCPDPARIDADTIEAAGVKAFWKLTADIEASGVADDAGELDGLEKAADLAQQRVAQLSTTDAQDALGESYLNTFRQRREELEAARAALGHSRARMNRDAIPSSDTLRGAWERMGVQDRRELLGLRFHALALSRSRSLVVWPAGSDVELPTRGFKRAPVLAPFPGVPSRARALTL